MAFEKIGEVVMLKEILADGDRVLVIANADEERVVRLPEPLRAEKLRAGDSLLLDSRSGYAYEKVPKSGVEELVIEEVPAIDYSSIDGRTGKTAQTRHSSERPYLPPDPSQYQPPHPPT